MQEEIKERFPDLHNDDISIPTICRALRNDMGLTRKVINKHDIEAAKHEMDTFIEKLQAWYRYPEQLVFIDETSKDNRDTLSLDSYERR
jgi:formyltetrahydrofolate synthetase